MKCQHILLINGSPRKTGTSHCFAVGFQKLFEKEGCTVQILSAIDFLEKKLPLTELCTQARHADIIGLIAPLYFDTLPYPSIWLLEQLAMDESLRKSNKCFFSVCQNGFPDITLFGPIQGTCKCFAEASGLKWLGSLSYPGGAIINGTPLEQLGKKGEKIIAAFKLAVSHMIQGKSIPNTAEEQLVMKIPRFLYRPLAAYMNHVSRAKAKKLGVTNLERKYYLE